MQNYITYKIADENNNILVNKTTGYFMSSNGGIEFSEKQEAIDWARKRLERGRKNGFPVPEKMFIVECTHTLRILSSLEG